MAIQSRATAFAALAAAVIGMASAPGLRGQTPAPADRLVVHEWGTFTSVQGSDGIGLEGLQHEEERLPAFVYSRTKVRTCPLRNYGYKGLEVPVSSVTQKMETPVIYFHSKTPRTLDVRVDFVKGLLTQWYPVSDRLGPPEETVQHGPLDLKTIDRSFLSWKVELLPGGAGVSPAPPAVAADDPWAYARDVDAATVRTLPRERPDRMGPVESERFLFYRGLGTFALPVAVESAPGGRAAVRNDGKLALPFAFALEITGRRRPVPAARRDRGGQQALVRLERPEDLAEGLGRRGPQDGRGGGAGRERALPRRSRGDGEDLVARLVRVGRHPDHLLGAASRGRRASSARHHAGAG